MEPTKKLLLILENDYILWKKYLVKISMLLKLPGEKELLVDEMEIA